MATSLANRVAAWAAFLSSALDISRDHSGSREEATAAEEQERAWLRASGWIIITVLALMLCVILVLMTLGLSYLDAGTGPAHAWHFHTYRIPAIILLSAAELGLIVAIVIRDRRRMRAEQQLRETQERMTLAAGAANLGLWQWDRESDRFWMTAHCREIYGMSDAAAPTMAAMTAAIHPDDLQKSVSAVNHALTAETTYEVQHRIVLTDDRMRWVISRGRPSRDAEGQMVHITGTTMDVTERVNMQAEIDRQRQSLVHLSRVGTIGELSAALAHELNQPLTAILSNAQAIQRMIRSDPINMDELRSAIADIIDDDSRAGDVIRHLRTLLKKEEPKRERVEMSDLVRRVLNLARNELTTRHVVPVIKIPEDLPSVLGDAVQLQQLILNLVLNATEAIASTEHENGILMITGSALEAGKFHLSISDTGPGLKPEIIDRLFEPFFSTKKQGLGLGLSISHAIVENHGGTIRAEGNSWGGATFHIFLPLARLA
ncbi:MAG TPA: ATP-binding protein [Rhizomicrobium sp.]|jgi:PAS domain S-box-containing protein